MPRSFQRIQETKSQEIRATLAAEFERVYGRPPSSNMEQLGPKYLAVVEPACTTLGIFPVSSQFNNQLTLADATGKIFNLWYFYVRAKPA